MDSNVFGLVISFGFLFVVLVMARLLILCIPGIAPEYVRKFVHISVSNWWFILATYFDDFRYRLVGPVFFIVVNSLATFLEWARLLGMNDKTRNYGLIYFPISLLVLVCLVEAGIVPEYAAGIGILVMGYGDGLAAIVGKMYGKGQIHAMVGKKTYAGSAAMFVTTFTVIALFSLYYRLNCFATPGSLVYALVVSALATVFELATPLGLDNLTVPIGTALLAGKISPSEL